MINNQKEASVIETVDSLNTILDELFKLIIQKYNKNFPKQMILETDNKEKPIMEFLIDDKYIDKKSEITQDNYKDYIDKQYQELVYKYDSYKEMFEKCKPYICKDIENGITNEKGEWSFYIPEDLIKQLNDKDINKAIENQQNKVNQSEEEESEDER